MASPSETTIRNLLLKELENRGIKAATEVQYQTPVGLMKPDALLQNGADYIVETKLGPHPKLLDAITQLYDYTKNIDVEGGFAILLPEELRRPLPIEWLEHAARDKRTKFTSTAIFSDRRPSQSLKGSLSEIADWISEHVLKPPEYVEADTSLAIKVLTDAVDYITESTLRMREDELEDIFGGKTVFENILQYEEGKYPLNEMRKAATYLLINQILFYHVLSSNDPITFPKIEEDYLITPQHMSIYFRRVLQVDYTPTFGFDVASKLPESAIEPLTKVVKAVKGIAPEKIKFDLLGKVFHDLIPFEIRKAVAAFYTNNEAAELLAFLSVRDPEDKVLDLACGSGTLLVAAYHRKKNLLEKTGKTFGSYDHKKFLEKDITGIDIMPFAAHLAVVHLSMQAPIYETERVRIAVWDSTELKPNQSIPAIHRELKEAYKRPSLDVFFNGKLPFEEQAYITKGAITQEGIGGEEIPLEKVDVIIMNPPFTRQERLPKQYKTALIERLREYKKQLHGQLGLWGYFLLLGDRFLKERGRIALVYPSRPLNAQSAENIRRFLIQNYIIEYIITTWERAAFSESTALREILFIARKGKTMNAYKELCRIVNLKTIPKTQNEAHKQANEIKNLISDYSNSAIQATILTQKDLENTVDNWFIHVASFNPSVSKRWTDFISKSMNNLMSFSNYLSKRKTDFVRGVETKSSFGFRFYDVFVIRSLDQAIKSHDKWYYVGEDKNKIIAKNKFTDEKIKIPKNKLLRGIRRASGLDTLNVSDKLDYIISRNFKGMQSILEKNSLNKFKKNQTNWHKYILSRYGKFLISRRFDISAIGTNLLAFYSKTPTTGQNLWSLQNVVENEAKILTLWFNSTLNLLQIYLKRMEHRGAWMEINKGMINNFLILNPNILNDRNKKALCDLFNKVKDVKLPSILEQLNNKHSVRQEIDNLLLRILGFNEDESNKFLNTIYPLLYKEIIHLKELMAG